MISEKVSAYCLIDSIILLAGMDKWKRWCLQFEMLLHGMEDAKTSDQKDDRDAQLLDLWVRFNRKHFNAIINLGNASAIFWAIHQSRELGYRWRRPDGSLQLCPGKSAGCEGH